MDLSAGILTPEPRSGGGGPLAAYETRRPTKDIDSAGLKLTCDTETVLEFVAVLAAPLHYRGVTTTESSSSGHRDCGGDSGMPDYLLRGDIVDGFATLAHVA